MTKNPYGNNTTVILLLTVLPFLAPPSYGASATSQTSRHFDSIRHEPSQLRNFLFHFPKGADLHNHLSGAVYAESYITWAAEDGKCVDLKSSDILPPPCDKDDDRPSVKSIENKSNVVNQLIDAFSTRNHKLRSVSGHDQFFSTFSRFNEAKAGREGDMIAETAARGERQALLYMELMQSAGMSSARRLARRSDLFSGKYDNEALLQNEELEQIVRETIDFTDRFEQRWKQVLGCDEKPTTLGCQIKVRYLAQVIRTYPREQVYAQTLLAFKLIEKDPRYVGLNLVAPEDHPRTLRDYRWQMETIGTLASHFPSARRGISLHAGELAPGLVPPEALLDHIRQAVELAGARRIGHGVSIMYEQDVLSLLQKMAQHQILVEINLTSNADILGIEGAWHPFETYRRHRVPLALSTDDEGVSRIDLTHEYQRAVQTYQLEYQDIKTLSRNSLAYSFLPGDNLFSNIVKGRRKKACTRDNPQSQTPSPACQAFLDNNEKARLQWELERQFILFEAKHR